jgi:diacylglycerol kinase (ATP)
LNDTHAITLFVNPVAGKGKSGKKYTLAVQYLQKAGFECHIVISQYPGQITGASGELAARGQRTVVACGGDGTVNEVINGIAGTDTALGIIPLGVCNNFATAIDIRKNIAGACKIIADGYQKSTDLIRVNEDKLISGGGFIAFASEVTAFANAQRKDKPNLNVLKRLGNLLKGFSFQTKTVDLRFNGNRIFGEVLAVTFENIRSSGTHAPPDNPYNETATPQEGQMEVRIFASVPRWKLLSSLSPAGKRDRSDHNGVTNHRTQAVHVQSLGHLGFYSDGDFVTSTPFRLQVLPKRLNVIVPHPEPS